jgi:hypothetical protein
LKEITMTSFVHPSFPAEHPGVARVESAIAAVQRSGRGFDSTKGISALLLAAIVSALVLVADQLTEVWSEGHLLTMWVVMWAVGFAAVALFAGAARSLAVGFVKSADAWSARMAQARADERFWISAQNDPRVMADLTTAMARQTDGAVVAAPALDAALAQAPTSLAQALQSDYLRRPIGLRYYI